MDGQCIACRDVGVTIDPETGLCYECRDAEMESDYEDDDDYEEEGFR